MKSKKLLSSIMALTIVATGSVALGTTAKASTLNDAKSTSVKVQATASQLYAGISSNGVSYWSEVKNVRFNEFVLRKGSGAEIVKFGGGPDYLSQNVKEYVKEAGRYSIEINALDTNSKVITYEKFYFDYDGSKFISYSHY